MDGVKRVWKFSIEPNSLQDSSYAMEILMPEGAITRHLGPDPRGVPCLWAEVDPSKEKKVRKFLCIGTGHGVVPENATYIGTMVEKRGFVWHVYEPDQT